MKDGLPDVDWHEYPNGKRSFSPRVILLLRDLKFRGGSRLVVSVGEHDTSGIPDCWRTWDDFVDEEGYEDCESRIVDDVTHWMYLPSMPKRDLCD